MEVFCNHIKEEAKRLYHMFSQRPLESLMPEQRGEFNIRVTKCDICLKHFGPWDDKVRDHCHYTWKYRGATHQKCKLRYVIPR